MEMGESQSRQKAARRTWNYCVSMSSRFISIAVTKNPSGQNIREETEKFYLAYDSRLHCITSEKSVIT